MVTVMHDASDTLNSTPSSWCWLSLFYVFSGCHHLHFAAEWRHETFLIKKQGRQGGKLVKDMN